MCLQFFGTPVRYQQMYVFPMQAGVSAEYVVTFSSIFLLFFFETARTAGASTQLTKRLVHHVHG